MKAKELMEQLIGEPNLGKPTVDTCKHGDPEREIKKVAVCMTATPNVLDEAQAWGADLVITHEPTFHDHFENPREDAVTLRKRELVAGYDFTLYRFHDFIHWGVDFDHINEGFLRIAGWKGIFDGKTEFVLDEPKTVYDLAKDVKNIVGIRHPRIIGDPNLKVTKLHMMLGAGGSGAADKFLASDDELMLTGEICEWRDGEPIRDAGQLGIPKAMLVMGHCACEAPGMKTFAQDLVQKYPALEIRYIESGDLFSYVD